MSEFGGLWKHQNNPACTKKWQAQSLQNVEVRHYTEEEGIYIHTDWVAAYITFILCYMNTCWLPNLKMSPSHFLELQL